MVTAGYSMHLAPDGNPFQCITLQNRHGMRVQFSDWGATWLSCQVPVNGDLREVLLGGGVENLPRQQAYLGASIGRYANRIAHAEFPLNGRTIRLTANQNGHCLHGGNGFDQRRWRLEAYGENAPSQPENGNDNRENGENDQKCGQYFVRFSLFSADGDQGFEGNLQASVVYTLTDDNALKIDYRAESDKDTALNLTNHAYFNLENADGGSDVRRHILRLNADFYLPVDAEGIPNSPLKHVSGSPFDFRTEKSLEQDFAHPALQPTKGYDHAFVLNKAWQTPAVRLLSPQRDLQLDVLTSQAALQVYSGNYLNGTPARNGSRYPDFAGLALETQCLPDTPNHPEWQNYGGITPAHQPYHQWTIYRFNALEN